MNWKCVQFKRESLWNTERFRFIVTKRYRYCESFNGSNGKNRSVYPILWVKSYNAIEKGMKKRIVTHTHIQQVEIKFKSPIQNLAWSPWKNAIFFQINYSNSELWGVTRQIFNSCHLIYLHFIEYVRVIISQVECYYLNNNLHPTVNKSKKKKKRDSHRFRERSDRKIQLSCLHNINEDEKKMNIRKMK